MLKITTLVKKITLFIIVILQSFELSAQLDKEFWFTVPDVTIRHNYTKATGSIGSAPAYFKFANGNKWDATVTIKMPANPYNPVTKTGFKDSTFTVPKFSLTPIDISKFIVGPYPWSTQGGVIFEYDATTNTYLKKIDFNPAANGNDPCGSLIQASSGKLYGMSNIGGANGFGVIFEYDAATNIYTKKLDFTGNAGTMNGGNPYGSFVQASNGKLYGMTYSGGVNNFGVLFEYDPVASTYTKILDFAGATNGRNPYGSLIQASNGMLYGMTYRGGTSDFGVLFELDPTTNTYTKKINFTGGASARYPYGSLMQASNGNLFGMTSAGGTGTVGIIFEYVPGAITLTKRYDFIAGVTGCRPYGSLMQASNGRLYGLTNIGGLSNLGVLFEYDYSASTYTKKVDFEGNVGNKNGSNPYGSLMQASNAMLYGVTYKGGTNSAGVLFEYNPATSTYTKKHNFTANNNGNNPFYGSLLQASSGKIFGLALGWVDFPGVDDVNLMENKPLNASGINKFGLKITSNLDITAYFESGTSNNKDIWALKGSNALGIEFWTPFQTFAGNKTQPTPNEAYSSIDIVATQNNTLVTIKLPPTLRASYGFPEFDVPVAGSTFTKTLQEGETFCLFPLDKSVDPALRLVGTKITSDKPIAVSIKDDSNFNYPSPSTTGSYDLQGDQLIPVNIIGKEYAVINTGLSTAGYYDDLYVLATQANTNVSIDGTNYVLAAGAQKWVQFPAIYATKPFIRVIADKPVYVLHIGGFGGESGAAILPPIDKCTGSSRVAFTRSYTDPFFIMLMVRKGAENKFYRTIGTDTTKRALPAITWYDIDGASAWLVGKIDASSTAALQFPVGVHTFVNTEDIFHLAIVNGSTSGGCFFGYFSNFNVFNPQSMVVETGGGGNLLCYGDSAQLHASGGTKYSWTPSDFLDNTFIADPVARNMTSGKTYTVTVSGACGLSATKSLTIVVGSPLEAKFTTDVFSGCAPLTVKIENISTGVTTSSWDLNGDGTLVVNNTTPFFHTFNNTTSDTIRHFITLEATEPTSTCYKYATKSVLVYPQISASYDPPTITDPLHCHPLDVIFNSTSVGKIGPPAAENALKYSWDFGDGGSSYAKSPTHTYYNFNLGPTTYAGSLQITDKYNYCKSTIPLTPILVQPFIKASFTIDKIENCSPYTFQIVNDSRGGVTGWSWDRDPGIPGDDFSGEGSGPFPLTNPTITNNPLVIPIKLTVNSIGGCTDAITRTITLNPRATAAIDTNIIGNALRCSPLTAAFTSVTTNATIFHWLIDGNAFDINNVSSYTLDNFGAASVVKPITFTATNQWGCAAPTQTINLTVEPYVKAEFAIDRELGCSPLISTFINASSLGSSAFQWDIGNDGSFESSAAGLPPQTFTYLGVVNSFIPTTIPIKLIAKNTAGCTSSTIKTVTVNPVSTATFTYGDNGNPSHCSPLIASFDGSAVNNQSWQWEFGSYGASTLEDPPFTFTNDAAADVTIPVTLKTNNSFGCSAQFTDNIIVRPNVNALFSLDKVSGCPPYSVNVDATASTGPITNYSWVFDGVPAPPSVVTKTFSNPSNLTGIDVNKNIKLTVSSGFCSDDETKSIVVYPQVDARYTASVLSGCNPLTVNFASQSELFGTHAPISNILWDFNDNSTSITSPITHTFVNPDDTNPKTFNVTLTATTSKGCTDVKTIPITANPNVTAAFNSLITQPCTPVRINVKDASFAGSTISTYTWTYPGGVLLPPEDKDFDIDFDNIIDPLNPINRTITLSLTNTFGCTSSKSQTFAIDPKVVAALTLTAPVDGGGTPIDRLCAPAKFTFSNNSTGADLTYTWDFKDGVTQTTNTKVSFDHTFANRTAATKQFDVQLSAVNLKGCSSSATKSVWAYPEVDAQFSMTRDSSCTPFYIKLKDESLNGTQWSWDFGHTILGVPQARTSIVPGETFTQLIDNETVTDQIKKYKINLTLDDLVTGCKDTISQKLEVYPKVISNFSLSPISGCSPTTVTFTNSSSGLGNYLWELDNGLSFNVPVPSPLPIDNASTVNEKTIKVKLTATNVLSCKSVSSKTITIAPKVIASYTSSILEGCDPFTANFYNLTPSPAYDYSWKINGVEFSTAQDYSNAFTNTSNPPVINKYKVLLQSSYKLNATCKDTVSKVITVNPRVYPNFTFTNSVDCHPLTTNINNSTLSYNSSAAYTWNLGNGTFSTLANLTDQLYKNNSATKDTTYSIKLIARSEHQCVDSISKTVIVHPRPIASYVMNNESVFCSPFPIELHNHSTGTDLSYSFNLDDGTIINTIDKNQVITHTYHNLTNDNKDYNITLKATTAFGCNNSTSQTVYAYPEVTAKFSLNPNNAACSPFTVAFNNTTNNGYFYQWSFDDGTNSNLMSPNHRFVNITENDKIFDVHLKSISAYDCVDDTTIPVTVYATPVANFSVNPPLKIFPDATFNFHNQSNPAADGWSYFWTFGDGYTSSLKEAGDHTYTTWGPISNDYIYTATLKVDAPHCSSSTTNILRLLPTEPIPFFTADIYESCSPLEAHFINASQYGNNYIWDFGDGTTSTEDEPIHVFTEPGYYVVKLKVSGDGGDSFYYKTFRVFQNPIASFAVYPNHVMLPNAEVHVYNLTKYAHRYEWDLGDGTLSTDKDPVHLYSQLGEYRISLRAFAHDTLGSCQDYTSVFPAVWVEGEGTIRFPDAFIPSKTGANGGFYDDIDYKNEVFHPVHYGVVEYKLMIFNRWGEQIFQSNDIKKGWDGYFKGKLCDQGVYVWRAIGKYTNGKSFDRKGNLTLLR